MLLNPLQDPNFYSFLFQIDRNHAVEARQKGCPVCGGPLHWANYSRSPRGGPSRCDEKQLTRFSLCCGREGCRKRLTPLSVRFLGRKVYFGAAILLFMAMAHGVTPARQGRLHQLFGVGRQTLVRWRQWWLTDFSGSQFWKGSKGHFRVPLDLTKMPVSMLEGFVGSLPDRLVALLRFISPISSASAPGNQAF